LPRQFPALVLQSFSDECIDRVLATVGLRGDRVVDGWFERPVLLVLSPLTDPATEEFDFGGRQFFVALRRRHFRVWVRRMHSLPDEAGFFIAWNDSTFAIVFGRRPIEGIEPESGFASLFVEPVACETLVSEYWANVPVVADRVFSAHAMGAQGEQSQASD